MKLLQLIRTESYKKGMLFSVLFNLLAKAVLFLLTIFIAKFFGSNIKTDIYFFIYGSMVLLAGFINSIDTQVLIPVSMRLRERQTAAASISFLNYFFRLYVIIGLSFMVAAYLFGTSIFNAISRFPSEVIAEYRDYFLLGSTYFFFMLLTNYLNNILASYRYFTVPMIISAINSCLIILAIIFLHERFDVLSVLMGGVIAYGLNLFILLWLLRKVTGWNFFARPAKIASEVWKNISFASLGQLATLGSNFLPLYLLSGFGQGVISVLNYGKNIADVPGSLVTSQLSNVSGIQINEHYAKNEPEKANDIFISTGKLLSFVLIPIGCFLFVFAKPVALIIYSGKNISEAAISDAAIFLQLFSVTLFVTGINSLVSRIFIAKQAIRQAFLYQLTINGLLIAAIWLMTGYYGALGYPYAVISINAVNFLAMYMICRSIAREIKYAAIIKYSLILLIVNGAISAGLYFLAPLLGLGAVLGCTILFLTYLFALIIINRIFHLNREINEVLQYVAKNIF